MRGRPRPQPRRHHSLGEVRQLLRYAEARLADARHALDANPNSAQRKRSAFVAEQDLVLVRLAADSGARRGEQAVLRLGDLDRRVLTIERGLSRGVLGSTKSSRTRRLTLGATTAAMIESHFVAWRAFEPQPVGTGSSVPLRSETPT
jgi:integrase